MPCYMYINGMKQEMDEDLFDEMAEALHQSSNLHNPPTATSTRWDVVEPLPTTKNQVVGKPMELMTRNPTTQNTSQNTIKRNYQHPSLVPTADAPFCPNPIYPNIVKPTFV